MTGSMAVYRLSFAMVLFFSIFMMLTIGVKTSSSYRGMLHNGYDYEQKRLIVKADNFVYFLRFWLLKFILFACLIVVSFKVPFNGLIKDCKRFELSTLFDYQINFNFKIKYGCTLA